MQQQHVSPATHRKETDAAVGVGAHRREDNDLFLLTLEAVNGRDLHTRLRHPTPHPGPSGAHKPSLAQLALEIADLVAVRRDDTDLVRLYCTTGGRGGVKKVRRVSALRCKAYIMCTKYKALCIRVCYKPHLHARTDEVVNYAATHLCFCGVTLRRCATTLLVRHGTGYKRWTGAKTMNPELDQQTKISAVGII